MNRKKWQHNNIVTKGCYWNKQKTKKKIVLTQPTTPTPTHTRTQVFDDEVRQILNVRIQSVFIEFSQCCVSLCFASRLNFMLRATRCCTSSIYACEYIYEYVYVFMQTFAKFWIGAITKWDFGPRENIYIKLNMYVFDAFWKITLSGTAITWTRSVWNNLKRFRWRFLSIKNVSVHKLNLKNLQYYLIIITESHQQS